MNIPRSEYPRPQFVRQDWLCLNGEWEFEIDTADSGMDRGLLQRPLTGKITVPFCPESTLSGIGNTDFLNVVWYRRRVTIPKEWTGRDVLLHFQAVDYDSTVWINGREIRRHRGGFTPFTCELKHIPEAVPGQEIEIVLRARDFANDPKARGKQSQRYGNHGCLYTRTTGIWQTVWLEPIPTTALRRPRITPDVAHSRFIIEQSIVNPRDGLSVQATLSDEQGQIAQITVPADSDFCTTLDLVIPENRQRLWSPSDPHLYDLKLKLIESDGKVIDAFRCYAGLRSISIRGKTVHLNNKPVFQRLVLDQGHYPDGILTAPTDEALKHDIELSMAAGFNGARLHQKVFEERFLYYCDKLGYLVWGEFADWGIGGYGNSGSTQQHPVPSFITEWLEAIERDYSHPAIIGWCPLNETFQAINDDITILDDVTRGMFLATKALDQTRPVLDASGYSHRVPETDIYDGHDYEQNPEKFRNNHKGLAENKPFINPPTGPAWSLPYTGQPYFVSEFGGIWWNPDAKPGDASWGYGERPKTVEEFYERFEKLCAVLLDDPNMFGYCYTQLTDVFQEQNGIYRFDRTEKLDISRLRAAQQVTAAIEKTGVAPRLHIAWQYAPK
jgi:beta-galactosidase/beta-glucuronidase